MRKRALGYDKAEVYLQWREREGKAIFGNGGVIFKKLYSYLLDCHGNYTKWFAGISCGSFANMSSIFGLFCW
jgi:hypothetical protein